MSNDLKKALSNMGLDLSKYPKDKISAIMQFADSISDPSKMNAEQINKLQVLLGLVYILSIKFLRGPPSLPPNFASQVILTI